MRHSKSKSKHSLPSTISRQTKMFVMKQGASNSSNRRLLFTILASFLSCVIACSYLYAGFTYLYASDSLSLFRPLYLGSYSTLQNSTIVRDSAVSSNEQVPDPCFGKYIFVHQLPPKFNIELIDHCDALSYHGKNMCLYLQNNGFGPPIFENLTGVRGGWYATDQFTLEVIFHSRMKRYKCLTNDSSSANALYVPYYAALEAGRNLERKNITVRDKVPTELMEYISALKEWKVFNGSDHFFVAGRISWDFRRPEDNHDCWGNKLMKLPEAEHILMLTIESTTYHSNEAAIPYPTYFHPSTSEEISRWQKTVARKKRDYLFAFAGAPRPWVTSIRNEVISQCLAAKNECILISCKDMTDKKCHSPLTVLKLFQSAKFCLQPPGDTPTRRSTFDSIISGCIPVFFDLKSAPEQYTWYFSKNYTQYSVYIPSKGVKANTTDIRKILWSIPDEEVKAMRSEVIKMIPRIIYAKRGSEVDVMEKDAFDIAVERILEKVRKLREIIQLEKKRGIPFHRQFS